FSFSLLPRLQRPTLFPYTTLFRSLAARLHLEDGKPVLGVVVGDALHRPGEGFDRRCGLGGRLGERHGSESILADHSTQSGGAGSDRKSTRLNSSHSQNSYAVFRLK